MAPRPRISGLLALAILAVPSISAWAGSETPAFSSATVLPVGPRQGAPGKNYFNAQGRKASAEGKYASFGVLDFHTPEGTGKVAKLKGLTLTLTQSVAAFSKDGPVTFYLTVDTGTTTDSEKAALKFDPAEADGLAKQLSPRYELGKGTFTKDKTGKVDTFGLKLEGEGEAYLRGVLNRGSDIRILMVPGNEEVAATYFGPGNAATANRPKLQIDFEPAP